MISYVIPTRDRPERLAHTLATLGALSGPLHEAAGGAEVVVVDDASRPPVSAPRRLANGLPVRVIRGAAPAGAAARNAAAREAAHSWLVMLDDDSHPLDVGHLDVIRSAPADVAAIGAEILLPGGSREHGGLPEVFVGCGVAIRRDAFLDVGGYDATLHYYAEEYDLCARLIGAGWRIVHDRRFRVRHLKVTSGRDMNVILHRLVRNNGWIMQRYAPERRRGAAVSDVVERYARIAEREGARSGFDRGLEVMLETIDDQPRRPLDDAAWDRFTGAAEVRTTLDRGPGLRGPVAVVDEGKHAWVVHAVLDDLNVPRAAEPASRTRVIGTLSPGPLMDRWEQRSARDASVVRPWIPRGAGVGERE